MAMDGPTSMSPTTSRPTMSCMSIAETERSRIGPPDGSSIQASQGWASISPTSTTTATRHPPGRHDADGLEQAEADERQPDLRWPDEATQQGISSRLRPQLPAAEQWSHERR